MCSFLTQNLIELFKIFFGGTCEINIQRVGEIAKNISPFPIEVMETSLNIRIEKSILSVMTINKVERNRLL